MNRRWRIRGRVQGVGFRLAAAQTARELGLECQARNDDDGSVECLASGPEEALARFEEWLRRGPPLARVESLERV